MLINSLFGSLVSDQAPAAIDKAFRIYQLPQGIFSVAIATVLFPTLARFADPRRDRQPAGDDGQRDAPDPLRPGPGRGRDPGPLGADDPARLPARRIHPGADHAGRDRALLVRLLAADQRPLPAPDPHLLQPPAALDGDRPGGVDLVVSALAALAPLQAVRRRRHRRRHRDRHHRPRSSPRRWSCGASSAASSSAACSATATEITIAAAALAGVSFGVWDLLDSALGRGLGGQIVSLGAGLGLGGLDLPRGSRSCSASPSWSRSCASLRRR